MKSTRHFTRPWFAAAALSSLLLLPAYAVDLITNGNFESGFTSWTRLDQLGSEGSFSLQSGTTSPVIGIDVPSPPEGAFAAMTDAEGPGSHVLYQDFVVSASSAFTLRFSLFTGNLASDFTVASLNLLDFSTPLLNQQARVDIMTTSADPFSVDAADVLQNLFTTMPGDPMPAGYTTFSFDLTALLTTRQGETLRLRFAEVDNVDIFNFGVDDVSLRTERPSTVPETLPWPAHVVSVFGVLLVGSHYRRRSVFATAAN